MLSTNKLVYLTLFLYILAYVRNVQLTVTMQSTEVWFSQED